MSKYITLAHNFTQIVTWLFVFFSLVPQNFRFLSPSAYKFDQYWDENVSFRFWLEIAQTLQVLDIILSALGMTRNSVMTVFPQIMSRLFILHMIFPLVEKNHYGIYMATLCWSFTEVTRFTFYSLKELDLFNFHNFFALMVGFFRYNSFIILYPVGVSGELICCFKAWQNLKAKPVGQKDYTIEMPNTLNFGFDFEHTIMIAIPIIYTLFFPGLYMHMWVQRGKHIVAHKKAVSEQSLIVPNEFKIYRTIPGLTKLGPKGQKLNLSKAEKDQFLKHTKDEVWLIDFWATWCPPCQAPMAHNQKMMDLYSKKWGPNVKIICISLDQDPNLVVNHVNSKGWTSLDHYKVENQFAQQMYKVAGVPHLMLVDKKGHVVFKGHPYLRSNLANDLTRLSNGLKLE